jgi:hypothetical protein
MYAARMGSDGMIYIPIFMTIGSSIQVISGLFITNWRDCNVGINITNGRDL